MVTLPTPEPGVIIQYPFLWSHEAARGLDFGAKDRPCAIVVAMKKLETGETKVLVVPITSKEPTDPDTSIEIPPAIAKQIGLAAGRSWVNISETNNFVWPGYEIQPAPNASGTYGPISNAKFLKLVQTSVLNQKKK